MAACVALGANLGQPVRTIARAAGRMDGILPGVRLAARSRVYHTAPLGPPDQPWYANMVARLDCPADMAPETLFEALMTLEADLGRNRLLERRWGPRVLDVDLLCMGAHVRDSARLTLPHPLMWTRAFVLLPLADVAPEMVTPQMLDALHFRASVSIIF